MLVNIHTHRCSDHTDVVEIRDSMGENTNQKYHSAGIHPQFASDADTNFSALEVRLKSVNCIAVGECGLDKLITVPMELQKIVFEKQIALAEAFELPLILHCVRAWNEVLELRKKWNPSQPWIFHGFRKTQLLASVLRENMFVGIGAAIMHDHQLQQILQQIPLERLFLETDDSTYSIEEIYRQVAKLKNIDVTFLEKTLEVNFHSTFRVN